jgi:hypothetical protein
MRELEEVGFVRPTSRPGSGLGQQENQQRGLKSRCRFHKHLTLVTYGYCKISLCVLRILHGIVHAMNGLAYFVKTVSYKHRMFMKMTTGVHAIRLFSLSLIVRLNKLECLSLTRFCQSIKVFVDKSRSQPL